MTGRNEKELEGVSLLGNQNNVYRADYAPEVLETFPINTQKMIIL